MRKSSSFGATIKAGEFVFDSSATFGGSCTFEISSGGTSSRRENVSASCLGSAATASEAAASASLNSDLSDGFGQGSAPCCNSAELPFPALDPLRTKIGTK